MIFKALGTAESRKRKHVLPCKSCTMTCAQKRNSPNAYDTKQRNITREIGAKMVVKAGGIRARKPEISPGLTTM